MRLTPFGRTVLLLIIVVLVFVVLRSVIDTHAVGKWWRQLRLSPVDVLVLVCLGLIALRASARRE